MARRRFTVRDIAEILEHWQAGRSIFLFPVPIVSYSITFKHVSATIAILSEMNGEATDSKEA